MTRWSSVDAFVRRIRPIGRISQIRPNDPVAPLSNGRGTYDSWSPQELDSVKPVRVASFGEVNTVHGLSLALFKESIPQVEEKRDRNFARSNAEEIMVDRQSYRETSPSRIRSVIPTLLIVVVVWSLFVSSAFSVSAADQLAAARDDFDEDEVAPAMVVDNGMVQGGGIPRGQVWIAVSTKNDVYHQAEEFAILRLFEVLQREIDKAQKLHDLDAASLKKLATAGRGDINRFVGRVAALDDRYQNGIVANEDFANYRAELRQLQLHFAKANQFGSKSLFGKTLRKIVGQTKPKVNAERESLHLTRMQCVVRSYVGPGSRLRPEQVEPLAEMLRQKIQASPLLFDDGLEIIMFLAEIPAEEFSRVLDQEQARHLIQKLDMLEKQYTAGS